MRRCLFGLLALNFLAGAPVFADIQVRGTVTTVDGSALSQVRVELLPVLSGFESGRLILAGQLEPEAVAEAYSRADGRFRLNVPQAGMWKLVVKAEGFVAMQFPPVVLLTSRELGRVVLQRAHPFSMRVLDPAGKPLSGAWVWVAGSPPPASGAADTAWQIDYRAARSGDDGRITVARWKRERLEYTILAPGYSPQGPTGGAGDLRLESGSVMRPIRVVDHLGEGVSDVLVRIGEHSWPLGLTGAEGSAHIPVRRGEATRVVLMTTDGRQQSAAIPHGSEPWPLELEEPLPVSGRVLDNAGGKGVAGATLWSGSDLGRLVRADAEGRYRLVAPDRSTFWIQAEAPGFLPRRIRIASDQVVAARAPSVTLVRQGVLTGTVTDVAGRPVAGVQVEASLVPGSGRRSFFSPDPADSRSSSDREGRFQLAGIAPGGHYELRANRKGYTSAAIKRRVPGSSESDAGVRLVLTPVRGAFGRVVDQEGRPVGGATASLVPAGRRAAVRMTPAGSGDAEKPFGGRSDEEGRFEVAEVPAQSVDLNVSKKGFTPVLVRGIQLSPDSQAFDLGTVVLVPGSRLSGKVVDSSGEGVEGASVHVLREVESPQRLGSVIEQQIAGGSPDTLSGEDGSFSVDDLVAGRPVHLFVHRSGFASAWLEHVDVPQQSPVSLVLEPGFGVGGQVVDEVGTPVEGARVHVEWRPTLEDTEIPVGPAKQRLTRTDSDGSFAIADLRPGKATLHVAARGFVVPDPIDLQLGDGELEAWHRVTVMRGAVLAGRIDNSDGDLVAGARIGVGSAAAFSDAEGVYRLEGVALGTASVEVFHPHYELASREIEVAPGVNDFDVTFSAGYEVSGRVVDTDGQALADAFVEMSYDGRRAPRKYRARSLGDGSFRLPSVVDGDYRLRAGKPGHAVTELRRAVRGAPVEDLEVVLEREAAIVGQVLGLDFDQLSQVNVRAESSEGRSHPANVDHQGRYEIRGLASGDWLVRAVLAGGRRQVQARLTLAPGAGEVRRDLEFEDALTLSGQVLYHGAPLAGTMVSLRGHHLAVERSVRTNHEGEFRIDDLAEGTYQLGLMNERELVVHNQDVELTGSRELLLDVSSGKVAGTVRRDTDRQGVDRALVVLRRMAASPGGENMLTAGTDPEGTFSFPRVPKGEYRLTVRKDGYSSEELFLDLTAGVEENDLEVLLTATAGLEVEARLESGKVPRHVTAAVLDSAGQPLFQESRGVDEHGKAWLASVPAGRWRLWITAPGAVPTSLTVEVPGQAVPVVLSAAGRLAVRVADLAQTDLIATLSLFGSDGRSFRGLDVATGFRDSWQLVGGRATVEGIPPGTWTVHVVAADGRLYSGSAQVRADSDTEMVLE